MTHIEYLLLCLAEELGETCVEAAALTSEAMENFSKRSDIVDKGTILSIDSYDYSKYICVSNDVVACIELLIEHNVIPYHAIDIDSEAKHLHLLLAKPFVNMNDLIVKHLDAQKAVSKMLRFGIDHNHPVFKTSGKKVLANTLTEIFAWNRYLSCKVTMLGLYDRFAIETKKDKVLKYLRMSVAEGRVLAYEHSTAT